MQLSLIHILILDEPMNGLDKNGVAEIREFLLKMKNENRLIILASHNREDIEILCAEVYEMEDGILRKIVKESEKIFRIVYISFYL